MPNFYAQNIYYDNISKVGTSLIAKANGWSRNGLDQAQIMPARKQLPKCPISSTHRVRITSDQLARFTQARFLSASKELPLEEAAPT